MSGTEFLRTLVETPSPSGREREVTDAWAQRIDPTATDNWTDEYGNTRVSIDVESGFDVGVFVHLDVVGYTVRHITDDGFIYVQRLGGVDPSLARSKRVDIHGRNGPVRGVFGSKSFHLVVKEDEQSVPDIGDIWIDIGADDRESVEEAGVHVGAPVTHAGSLDELQNDRVVGPGLDNAAGAWAVAEALRRCSPDDLDANLHGFSMAQTEIQHFGSKYMDLEELNLDVALVVDVTFATGTPPIRERRRGGVSLGDGPSIRHNRENHPDIVRALERAGDRADVPLQHEPIDSKGGERRTVYETTDGAYLSKKLNVPVGFVGIPCRYIHSPGEVVNRQDLDRTVTLLDSFFETLPVDVTP